MRPGTCRGLPPPRPVVHGDVLFSIHAERNREALYRVPSRACHSILPVLTSTALNWRSRSPTKATPPAVESAEVRNGARCSNRPKLLHGIHVIRRQFTDVAVGPRHLVEAPPRAASAASASFKSTFCPFIDRQLWLSGMISRLSPDGNSWPASCGRLRCSGTNAIHSRAAARRFVAVMRLAGFRIE